VRSCDENEYLSERLFCSATVSLDRYIADWETTNGRIDTAGYRIDKQMKHTLKKLSQIECNIKNKKKGMNHYIGF
jgi:hypothetical protein